MTDRASFSLNGTLVDIADVDPNTPLSRFVRARGLTGTKEGCAEGDCGACTMLVSDTDAHGEPVWRAMCSCITFVPMVAGREVRTVEGLAAMDDSNAELHPVQQAMVKHAGSQCGYCTPGFCVSMAEQYAHAADAQQACRNLDGNLCRCTGYRPIRDAMAEALDARDQQPDLVAIGARSPKRADLQSVDVYAGARFFRPTSVAELLALKSQYPDAPLVGGATELGVLSRKRFVRFPTLISTEGVLELRAALAREDRIIVGGASTLTHLEEIAGERVPALAKMLRVFASRQIRNRATLAGNIATASPIGDMPPVLLALDATILCASERGTRAVPVAEFFVGYRKTVLAPDEIILSITIPIPPASSLLESYKVSKRRELDISAVAACFRADVDAHGVITDARLAFGGVAATPVRVRAAEDALKGKTLKDGWRDAARIVQQTLEPITDVRASLEYRRAVAGALLEKWAKGEQSDALDVPVTFERAPVWPEPDASRALRHESARGHVTGGALYVDDVAERNAGPGRVLELWPVTVPHARARIEKIDVTKAIGMPGVRAILTGHDVPGENDVGAIRKDEPLLPTDETRFYGQMVAVVVADTLEQARAAAKHVDVKVTPLPAVLGIADAIAKESFHTQPHVIARGDAAGAMKSAAHRLTGEVTIGGQEHFYLETHAASAEVDDDGVVRVSSSTQHPSEVQAVVSHVLHLPRNQVVVTSPRMGGGFGGKETQGNTWAALVALAAQTCGKPARIMLDRDLDMELTGKRHPFFARFEVGFGDDGAIEALTVDLVSDGGCALDLSESICDRALFHLDNAYFLPHVRFSGRVAKTNAVSHTAFRGFGGPQGMLVIEEIVSRVAGARGLPLERVRERNFYAPTGQETPYGQAVVDHRVPAMWARAKERAQLDARRAEIDAWNARHEGKKRGLAMTPVKFGISFTASFLNQAGALVVIYRDGSVQVNHGGTEMGQGLHTKILGVAMRELGVPRESVRVMKTQTDKVPNTSATAASAGADLNGAAVVHAMGQLVARLKPVAAQLLTDAAKQAVSVDEVRFEGGHAHARGASVAFSAVCERAYVTQVQLSAAGFYRTPDIAYDRAAGRGKPFHYFAYGVCAAEVELDVRTGMKRVVRVDVVHDVGDSLNPIVDRGQVEGGLVQGIGWLTAEELKWSDDGRLLTHSASTYQIPSMADAPAQLHVELWDDVVGDAAARQDAVVHGSKAVGEPPLMLALAVREALRDAVRACGATGPIALPSPLTHEALFSLSAPARARP